MSHRVIRSDFVSIEWTSKSGNLSQPIGYVSVWLKHCFEAIVVFSCAEVPRVATATEIEFWANEKRTNCVGHSFVN